MTKLERNMIKLKFNINSVGFEYWKKAVEYYQKGKILRMSAMYEKLSKEFNTTYTRVERAMRYTTEQTRDIIKKEYYLSKVNNNTIIEILVRGL